MINSVKAIFNSKRAVENFNNIVQYRNNPSTFAISRAWTNKHVHQRSKHVWINLDHKFSKRGLNKYYIVKGIV